MKHLTAKDVDKININALFMQRSAMPRQSLGPLNTNKENMRKHSKGVSMETDLDSIMEEDSEDSEWRSRIRNPKIDSAVSLTSTSKISRAHRGRQTANPPTSQSSRERARGQSPKSAK